jgi:hypothetical protein
MCVIILCETEFPKLATLESAEELNSHGGGIAWIENGQVKYKKGIKSKQIFEITKKINLPAIIHFRIASIGGVNDELCHPFQINTQADTEVSGTCDSVLFHNGTWTDWKEMCMKAVVSSGNILKFPSGQWSDSRAMAWLADKFGIDFLNLIDNSNKIAVLTPQGIRKFGRFIEVEKNLCSNDYFDNSSCLTSYNTLYKNKPTPNVYGYGGNTGGLSVASKDEKKDEKRFTISKEEEKKLSKKEKKALKKMRKLQAKLDKTALKMDSLIDGEISLGNDSDEYNAHYAELQRKQDEAAIKRIQAMNEHYEQYDETSKAVYDSAVKPRNDRRGRFDSDVGIA